MAEPHKEWWEIALLFFGTFGGLKAVWDIVNYLQVTKPRLVGEIEQLKRNVEPPEKLTDDDSAYLVAEVFIVNLNKQPTTARSWELEVETKDGERTLIRARRRDNYWDSVREESRPNETDSLPLALVFMQNIGHRGWLYFPWNLFHEEVVNATLIVTDVRGKQHRIKRPSVSS